MGRLGGESFRLRLTPLILTISFKCYLAPPDLDEDPAVYGSSTKHHKSVENGKPEKPNGLSNGDGINGHAHDRHQSVEELEDDTMSEGEGEGEDDSGPLLTVQPGFNRLLLVLRDERVMHFVKYLSASAPGCRWDVYGEWEVGMVQENETDTE